MTAPKMSGGVQFVVGLVVGALATIATFQGQLTRLDERTAMMSVQLAEVRQAVIPRRVAEVTR